MKRTHLFAAILACTLSVPAFAQSTNINSTSNTNSNLNANSAVQGGTQNINSYGASSVKTVPNMAGDSFYGSFSQDGCMVSGGGGVTVLGFGANAVTPIRDSQCDKRRSFERVEQAAAMTQDPNERLALRGVANDVLCSLGGPVYNSMKARGLCSKAEVEYEEGPQAADKANTAPIAQVQQPAATVVASNKPVKVADAKDPPKVKVVSSPNPITGVQTYIIDSTGTHPLMSGDGKYTTTTDPVIAAKLGQK